jgi:hypothetical protein
MAVERVQEGEAPSSVIPSCGFNRTTIYKWISAVSMPGAELRALRARPATGRPRSLAPQHEGRVFRWINGKDPRQYGLDSGLWTRGVVADLIERTSAFRFRGLTCGSARIAARKPHAMSPSSGRSRFLVNTETSQTSRSSPARRTNGKAYYRCSAASVAAPSGA